jgi:putative addiction module antidote
MSGRRDDDADSTVLRIRRIGNSVGLILPKELLARLKLRVGDKLHAVEQPHRGLKLSPYDDKHARALEAARKLIREYQDSLKALAK